MMGSEGAFTWEDVQMMESRERRWMLIRLAKYREQERDQIDGKIKASKNKSKRSR